MGGSIMKQLLRYFLVILLWIAAVVLWAAGVTFWVFVAIATLHAAELLIIGFRTGREYGVPAVRSIILCLLFGYVWWLPIRKTMKSEDFTAADFIEDGEEPWREQVNA
jgi:cytochrome c biogenesis protein CcdA